MGSLVLRRYAALWQCLMSSMAGPFIMLAYIGKGCGLARKSVLEGRRASVGGASAPGQGMSHRCMVYRGRLCGVLAITYTRLPYPWRLRMHRAYASCAINIRR